MSDKHKQPARFAAGGGGNQGLKQSVIGRSRNEIPFVVPVGINVVYYHVTLPADGTLTVILDKEGTAINAFYGTLEVKNG